MAIDLGVDEGDAVQILVPELPDVDLLAHSGHQEPGHGRDRRNGTLDIRGKW
jgi:hypothetical protein